MNILITGGGGFIGSALSRALVSRGHLVTVMDTLSKQVHGDQPETSYLYQSLPAEVTFMRGDVRNREHWLQALSGQDAVVHLAAETGTGQSMYEVGRYTDVNIGGTSLLLDILAKGERAVERIVVASSRAIYGEGRYSGNDGVMYPSARAESDLQRGRFECYDRDGHQLKLMATDEQSRLHPTSVYGITKQVQEQLVLTVGPSLGITCVALRYQNVYGPGQSLHNPYTGILSIFSTLMRTEKDIDIFEDGRESRDFVFIDDVVEATARAVEKDMNSSQALNVGSGIATSVREVANALQTAYGTTSKLHVTGHYRVGDIRHNYADLNRVKAALDFTPKVDFASGIAKFARWVKGEPVIESKYSKALAEMAERGLFK